MINRIKLQLALAFFWFLSAYLTVGAVLPWEWAWRCAWFNLIIGMVSLLLITRTKEGDSIFYKGPQRDRPGLLQVALLWAIPIAGLFIASLWWFMRLLGIFDWLS